MGHEEGPVWVPLEEVVWFHDTAIENHGGRRGIRSQGLLDQAITRPQRIWYYESMANMARLAACCTASIVFIHPLVVSSYVKFGLVLVVGVGPDAV